MGPALALEITGLANSAPVEVVGSGEVDAGHLRLEIGIARALFTFDPALIAVSLLDVLAIVGNALGATYVRSRTDLYDENGREAGGWRVLAALTRDTGKLRLQGQMLDHLTYLEPGERVVGVEPWTVLAQPLDREGVLLRPAATPTKNVCMARKRLSGGSCGSCPSWKTVFSFSSTPRDFSA